MFDYRALRVAAQFTLPAILAVGVPASAQDLPEPAPAAPITAAPQGQVASDPSRWPDTILEKDAGGYDLSKFGYKRFKKKNKGLVVTGLTMFAASYGISTFVGAVASDVEYDNSGMLMYIPVAGPVAWSATDGGSGTTDYLLALDTLAQATGIVLFAVGMAGKPAWKRSKTPSFMVAPSVSTNGASLHMGGTF